MTEQEAIRGIEKALNGILTHIKEIDPKESYTIPRLYSIGEYVNKAFISFNNAYKEARYFETHHDWLKQCMGETNLPNSYQTDELVAHLKDEIQQSKRAMRALTSELKKAQTDHQTAVAQRNFELELAN